MKFTCNRDNLIDSINVVQRAIPTKTTMAVLEGILIEVKEELKMTAYDGDLGITYEIPAIIEEVGSILVSSKTFGDIIKKLPDIYVTIETSEVNNLLIIKSGKAKFEISIMDQEEYPLVNFLDENENIYFDSTDLALLIKQSIYACSNQEEAKPMFKGILIEKEGNRVNFVALDGNKMAKRYTENESEEPFKILAPARMMNEVSKILHYTDDKIFMSYSDSQVMFHSKNFKIISRLIKTEFINYIDLIPREEKLNVLVSTKDFLSAIERAALVMNDSSKYHVLFETDMDDISITARAEKGYSSEKIGAQVNGENIKIGFNTKHFIECLRVIDDETIVLFFTGDLGPCIVRGQEDEKFLFLIMPVRFRS